MSIDATALPDLDAFCARYLLAWNDHDAAAIADLVTDDVVWEDPALPGPARGAAAVQEFMRAAWLGFPDLRFDETDRPHRTASGDQVAWRWRMRGMMTGLLDPPGFAPTGRAMEIEGVDLWTMRDGRQMQLPIDLEHWLARAGGDVGCDVAMLPAAPGAIDTPTTASA